MALIGPNLRERRKKNDAPESAAINRVDLRISFPCVTFPCPLPSAAQMGLPYHTNPVRGPEVLRVGEPYWLSCCLSAPAIEA